MKFQLCTCKKHPFEHGNFFDENGPYFRGEGLLRLSGDIFSQEHALAFVQGALESGKITLEEACAFGRDQILLSLPDEDPSGLALYQKNEKARTEKRLVTEVGKQQLAIYPESPYSLMRFMKWLLPHSLFSIFFAKRAEVIRSENYAAYQWVTEQMQKKRDEAAKEKLKKSNIDEG